MIRHRGLTLAVVFATLASIIFLEIMMPYIKQVEDHEAQGEAKTELDKARQRAGRVWNIVRIMTPNPRILRDSINFYLATMYGRSPLTRAQREMLAVVVSKVNHCVY